MPPLDDTIPEWSLYDIDENPEYDFYENTVVEFTDIAGIECYYYELDQGSADLDEFRGKQPKPAYKTGKKTKVRIIVEDQEKIVEAFGMTMNDVLSYLYIPKYTFNRDVNTEDEPHIGDVVKFVWNGNSFEVVDVTDEDNTFQLYKPVWELKCRPYRVQEQEGADIIEDTSTDLDQEKNYQTDYADFYS